MSLSVNCIKAFSAGAQVLSTERAASQVVGEEQDQRSTAASASMPQQQPSTDLPLAAQELPSHKLHAPDAVVISSLDTANNGLSQHDPPSTKSAGANRSLIRPQSAGKDAGEH